MDPHQLETLARSIRRDLVRMTTAAGSGHLTSSLSAVELLVTLFFGGHFRARLRQPKHALNDRFVLSKGHAAPLLYALYAAAGAFPAKELLTLRRFGSRLEGHPMPSFPYAEVPTGSLGQGLSAGAGIALAAAMDELPIRAWVLLGDSEMAEGQVWEAVQFAGFRKLGGLTAVVDLNRLGQSGPTMLQRDAAALAARVRPFGWHVQIVDGHRIPALARAYAKATAVTDRPTMIIARTVKGQGISFLADREGWHGKALSKEDAKRALAELGPAGARAAGEIAEPPAWKPQPPRKAAAPQLKVAPGSKIAPREAVGRALVRLAPAFPELVVLDGEVKNSTHTEEFEERFPERFVEGYIAEQNLVTMSAGLATRGKLPVFATFAAFLTRAYDQLRMAAYGGRHLVFVGTHAGVHIGPDGPSQMGLEDLAMFRALWNSTVLSPADAMSADRLTELALRGQGLVYVRAVRASLPVLYEATTRFRVGGSHLLRRSKEDVATVVATGVAVHEALAAADQLAKRKIAVRVVDAYSVKPVDASTLRRAASQTKRLVVVEDHRPEGGLAEAVRTALGESAGCVTSIAVRELPRSGKPEQLLAQQGIDRKAIVEAVLAGA